jgi:hypothetical protein
LNNIRLIEQYLYNTLAPGERLAFKARLLLSPSLRMDFYFQKKAYYIIKMYHREKIKEKMESLHRQIFSNPDNALFQRNIYQLFKSKNK